MVWIYPKQSVSLSNSSIFSKYKTLQQDYQTGFVLQQRKTNKIATLGGDKIGRGMYRIISRKDHPMYEVAYSNSNPEIQQDWTYITTELAGKCCQLPWEEREQCCVDEIRKLAKAAGTSMESGETFDPIDDEDGDNSDHVRAPAAAIVGAIASDFVGAMASAWKGLEDQPTVQLPKQGKSSYLGGLTCEDPWVANQLALRVEDFSDVKDLLIMCCTWNTNGKKPRMDEPLNEAIVPHSISAGLPSPDILVIGFQEIVDLSASNFIVNNTSAAREPWELFIEGTLVKYIHDKQYIRLSFKDQVGLSIVAYAEKNLYKHIRNVYVTKTGVGLMGVGGNKGAVCMRMDLYDSSVCFVNSHLAAHVQNVKGRIADFHNINKKTDFWDEEVQQILQQGREVNFNRRIEEHGTVFWIGDLNFRLDLADLAQVSKRIRKKDWPYLLDFDQLSLSKQRKMVFQGYQEGEIKFAPTYKFRPGSNEYENKDKKQRCPSWCDRIQWKGKGVKQLVYGSALNMKISDHKPVYAYFEMGAKLVNIDRRKKILTSIEALSPVDRAPKIKLSANAISFGHVSYGQKKAQSITIKNSGKVVVQFSVASEGNKNCEEKFRPWITVDPATGEIGPGQSADLQFTVLVDNKASMDVMLDAELIKTPLLLSLVDSDADQTIKISSTWYTLSSRGCDISLLNKMHLQFAKYKPTHLRQLLNEMQHNIGESLLVPKEIVRCINYIVSQGGMKVPGMFPVNISQAPNEVAERDKYFLAIDRGTPFPKPTPEVFIKLSECFVIFLESLSTPLVPNDLEVEETDMPLSDWCEMMLLCISPVCYQTLIYILSFLHHLLGEPYTLLNRLTTEQLGVVFGRCLMQTALPLGTMSKYQSASPAAIIQTFLETPRFFAQPSQGS